jgi:hypothetical protein
VKFLANFISDKIENLAVQNTKIIILILNPVFDIKMKSKRFIVPFKGRFVCEITKKIAFSVLRLTLSHSCFFLAHHSQAKIAQILVLIDYERQIVSEYKIILD